MQLRNSYLYKTAMSTKKIILHVINSLDDGGAEAILFRLVIQEKEYKHIIISISGDDGKYRKLLTEAGEECILMRTENIFMKFLLIFKLAKIIKSIHPHAVQTWMYQSNLIGGIAAIVAGVKNIIWGIHNSSISFSENKISRIFVVYVNAIASHFVPKKIVSVSHSGAYNHKKIGFKKNIFIINNGYPTDFFYPDLEKKKIIRKELNIKNSSIVIGNVARLDPQKDHINLLNAISILKKNCSLDISFICILVGKGVDSLSLEIKKRGLEKYVLLLGQRSNMDYIMNLFDIYVCSSATEAFPNTLCEAMACGVPCVTTDVGDSSYIVGETGWVVPPNSPEQLSSSLFLAMTDHLIKNRKIAARRRIVERFNIKNMSDLYLNVWS